MNRLSKNKIVGILVFVLIFIYGNILELQHITDIRIKARIKLMPEIIICTIFFIYAIYTFSKDEKKK